MSTTAEEGGATLGCDMDENEETIEVVNIIVPVQTVAGDYKVGDFLNALDHLYKYFSESPADQDCGQLCDAMEMYSKHQRYFDE